MDRQVSDQEFLLRMSNLDDTEKRLVARCLPMSVLQEELEARYQVMLQTSLEGRLGMINN